MLSSYLIVRANSRLNFDDRRPPRRAISSLFRYIITTLFRYFKLRISHENAKESIHHEQQPGSSRTGSASQSQSLPVRDCRRPPLSHASPPRSFRALSLPRPRRDATPRIPETDINFVLGKLFTALAQNRIPPRNAAILAYIGQLMLHSLRGVKKEYPFTYNYETWNNMLEKATVLSDYTPDSAPAALVPNPPNDPEDS